MTRKRGERGENQTNRRIKGKRKKEGKNRNRTKRKEKEGKRRNGERRKKNNRREREKKEKLTKNHFWSISYQDILISILKVSFATNNKPV